ncbi:MAG: nucleotidyltransferase family protein [Gammaproteobacteria bacterium]|nr:nucleotidyltransferase family protein [Gammaproteobacteria bacterium]
MRAMILAAGLGKRMQPLTANIPKPLLQVGDKTLIEYQIERLARAGVDYIVINHHYLGKKIEDLLGSGSRYGVSLKYSPEAIRLETAGGIIKALPLLEDESFIVVNADVWTDFPFASLAQLDGQGHLAHLVLVENAEHNPYGDFHIDNDGRVHEEHESPDQRLTFSGISVLHRNLFSGYPIQPRSLVPLLSEAMEQNKVSGEVYRGVWMDIGTPARLRELNDIVREDQAE